MDWFQEQYQLYVQTCTKKYAMFFLLVMEENYIVYDINATYQLLTFISYYNSEHACRRHYRSDHIVFKGRICFMLLRIIWF